MRSASSGVIVVVMIFVGAHVDAPGSTFPAAADP
jgi:hypothetical protein